MRQCQSVFRGYPHHRLLSRIALVESGPFHEPARRQLHAILGRILRHHGTGAQVLTHPGPNAIHIAFGDNRICEERADAPRVTIGLVEHHALTPS
ncbi:hypothetical protein XW60_09405 [Mycobacteroides abscessus subsp. bolletii]|nr:hypothetical protein XW60_09405 [Mycobacteroides abscessus subsp. bolletii]